MYYSVHLSAECYPIAKTGGLGDVVGALPKYLNQAQVPTCVIVPLYNQKWIHEHSSIEVWKGEVSGYDFAISYEIRKAVDADFGFDIYFVHIPELLFRENIYGYEDDPIRFIFFQRAALNWICQWPEVPAVLHCHDHHTGLIPFMVNFCPVYSRLLPVKTIFTIHNGLYTGAFGWSLAKFIPEFSIQHVGLLDWDNNINPLAAAIKCCRFFTTVSRGYLDELKFAGNSMQWLYNEYWQKSIGIVNGIDNDVWNPSTDPKINFRLKKNLPEFKKKNKIAFCESSGIDPNRPLMVFIGRLVHEKGGEILPQTIGHYLSMNNDMSFFVLGSGNSLYEDQVKYLSNHFNNSMGCYIGYNESLAHQLYAAADFLIMPSLVEPCGLNQLYALRYATVPVVRSVGGLKDTVVDIGDENGYGIRFNNANVQDIYISIKRCVELYENKDAMNEVRKRMTSLNFSWEIAVKQYVEIYHMQ